MNLLELKIVMGFVEIVGMERREEGRKEEEDGVAEVGEVKEEYDN